MLVAINWLHTNHEEMKMRLTKDIKNQILANILRDHEIVTEAKSIMMDSRDLAYAITLDVKTLNEICGIPR